MAQEVVAPIKNGVLWPSPLTLYSAMAMQSEFNGRMLEMVRELGGGTFINLPSSLADLETLTRRRIWSAITARLRPMPRPGRFDAAALGLYRVGIRARLLRSNG